MREDTEQLKCFECGGTKDIHALVLFDPTGEFEGYVESHDHHYVCCLKPNGDFEETPKSRFMVIPEEATRTCFPATKDVRSRRISDEEIRRRLPKLYAALTGEDK